MYSLGIDIGGTKCAVILGKGDLDNTIDGFIIDKKAFPTEVSRGWKAVIDNILSVADELLESKSIKTDELIGIGISCGGPLDSKKGTIHCPPNLPDWDNVPIVEIFEKHFNVKTYLQNDANACAVAEWKFGAAKGCKNAVFLTFGTGMGAGLILDGKLYSGTNDLAGEVGHIRLSDSGPAGYGKIGSFEGFCSGGGIARLGEILKEEARKNGIETQLNNTDVLTAKNISEAAKHGDEIAKKVYRICAEKLGQGLSILIDILNPEVIVIGSIYQRDTDMFEDIINEVMKNEALPGALSVCKIRPAALADNIGDFAALGLVFN